MRTSIAGAVILLAGAGASTAAAVTSGNNLKLSGSDTLFEVTNAVISGCSGVFPDTMSGFATKGITYLGGGSGVGIGEMRAARQEIAPMSRPMKSTEYCSGAGANPDTAADIMVGLDGVAIVVSKTSSCSTTAANNVGNPSFSILTGGTGASTGTYTLSSTLGASIDALRVLYMGIEQTGTTGSANFGCGTDLRKTMIKNWRNLFTTDCGTGDTHCAAGLTHAWRRPDVSGTTDAFQGVLLATNGAGRALGTMSTVPSGAAQKINMFCNTFEANDSNHQPQFLDGQATLSDGITTTPLSDGRVNDQSDQDPIRTPCDVNDSVCRADGTLGVVLPIFLPDVAYSAGAYPATECSLSCTLIPIIKGTFLPPGFKCPIPLSNGANNLAGYCFVPKAASGDPRCYVTDPTARCVGTIANKDARAYNESVIVQSSELPSGFRFAGATYQYGLDRNNRILSGAFYREHMLAPSSYNTRVADTNYTGICKQSNDTEQIGCLADADDCSLGYAAREAAQTFPGAGGSPPLDTTKALAIDGTPPFNPTGNPDQSVLNLLVGGATPPVRYELARRLYLASGPNAVGFANLPSGSGEQMLAQCYSKDSLVGPALTANGFIPIPATLGGIQCLDYDQTQPTNDALPVNTQGPGNIALPGCATAGATGAGHDGCAGVTNANGYKFGL